MWSVRSAGLFGNFGGLVEGGLRLHGVGVEDSNHLNPKTLKFRVYRIGSLWFRGLELQRFEG